MMSPADPTLTIRRILVALDASPHSLAALEAAADLAGRMEAELLGIFVEDVAWLRAAESPYARELLYPHFRQAALSPASLERTLRTQAEKARSALASAAQRARIPWSFRCVRGQVAPELRAAAAEADLLAMGKLGWSLGALRIGSTALELAESTIPVLLLSEHAKPAALHLLVYYDASPEAARALLCAAQLAAAYSGNLRVLLATREAEKALAMQKSAERLLAGTDLKVRYRPADPADPADLLDALREPESGIFVLGGRDPFQRLPCLAAVLRESKVPVLLLRNGASAVPA